MVLSAVSCAHEEPSSPNTAAQSIPLYSRVILSAFVRDSFVVDVSLPESYDRTPDMKYPVLYMTDGNWRRGQHQPIHDMARNENVREMIVVGVSYPDGYNVDVIRVRDLITGACSFLSCLLHEVIPYVDSSYRTIPTERTLWGSSYGGYFSMFTLFHGADTTKDVFKNYIVASAAGFMTTQDSGQSVSLFDYEARMYQKTHELNASLYITVGGNETNAFVASCNQLTTLLSSRAYTGFTTKSFFDPGKDHYSVWEPTLYEGIRMFMKKQP